MPSWLQSGFRALSRCYCCYWGRWGTSPWCVRKKARFDSQTLNSSSKEGGSRRRRRHVKMPPSSECSAWWRLYPPLPPWSHYMWPPITPFFYGNSMIEMPHICTVHIKCMIVPTYQTCLLCKNSSFIWVLGLVTSIPPSPTLIPVYVPWDPPPLLFPQSLLWLRCIISAQYTSSAW